MAVYIPLFNEPNQQFNVVLDEQNCSIQLRQLTDALYLSLSVEDVEVCNSHICENCVLIPVFQTSTFRGKLLFVDTLASSDPNYAELESRFILVYVPEGEL